MLANHIRALGIKTIAISIFSALLTPMLTDRTVGHGILIGIAISILSYILVDLMLLPATDNTTATAADFVIAAVVYWIMIRAFDGIGLTLWEILLFAAIVAVSEWFLHKYLARFVLKR